MVSPNGIQLLGYAAGATCTSCYIARGDQLLRLLLIFGVGLYALHFALLGAQGAALIELVTLTWQGFLLMRSRAGFSGRIAIGAVIGVCVTYALVAALCWQGGRSAIPAAACIWCALVLALTSGTRLRVCLLVCDGLWLANGLVIGSQGGVLFAVIALGLNLSLLYRRLAPTSPAHCAAAKGV